jgi:hypothetical protein
MKLILLAVLLVLVPIQAFAGTFPSRTIASEQVNGELAAEYWKWFIGIQSSDGHPYFDLTGKFTQRHNQNTEVFFLSGAGKEEPVVRDVIVPLNKPILIPAHFAGYGYFPDVAQKAKDLVNIAIRPPLWFSQEKMVKDGLCIEACNHEIQSLRVTVDGQEIKPVHVQYGLFKAYYPPNTAFFEGYHHAGAAEQNGMANSLVDGYFALVDSLQPGPHVIHWEGKSAHYNDDITYNVMVQ